MTKTVALILASFVRAFSGLFGSTRYNLIRLETFKQLTPILVVKSPTNTALRFFIPSAECYYQTKNLYSREPETIEWIDTFRPQEVLWDIGANIGLYSVYALKKEITVFSFEPQPTNYFWLTQNILLNKLEKNSTTFPFGVDKMTRIDEIYFNAKDSGKTLAKKQEHHQGFKVCIFEMDNFSKLLKLSIPNHIKIDIDGLENNVIIGMQFILSQKSVKSVLIEINNNTSEIHNLLTKNNFIICREPKVGDRQRRGVPVRGPNFIYVKK